MKTINSQNSLREAIAQLEVQQAQEAKMLKAQFHAVYESIKPLNFIKSTIQEASESPELQDNLINTSVGLTAGFVSKVLVQGLSGNPLVKLIGSAVMFGITNLVTKHPETVKAVGKKVFTMFLGKRNDANLAPPQKAGRGRLDVM